MRVYAGTTEARMPMEPGVKKSFVTMCACCDVFIYRLQTADYGGDYG